VAFGCFLYAQPPPQTSPLSLHDALPIYHGLPLARIRDRERSQQPQAGGLRAASAVRRGSFRRWTRAAPSIGRHAQRSRRVRECRSEEHTSELQSRENLVCRLLLEKKNKI